MLERLDLSAATNALDALDALDASAPAWTEGPESRGVTLLRQAGTLGKSGNRLTRALISWTSGSPMNGSPVLSVVFMEATRQAVRSGRAAVEPVDLLLGILALDRALFVAGRSLPEKLAKANSAPALMRRHGVRQSSLVTSASVGTSASVVASDSAIPSAGVPDSGEVRPSAAADRVRAVAQLSAAEHGSPTVDTVHLLAALLDESATDTGTGTDSDTDADADADVMVVRLLAADQVDVAALRAELGLRLGA